MRLIDADNLISVIQKACERENGYGTPLAMMRWFMNIIVGQPTVEAKPVVHGEWIKIKDFDENDNALFECTNCHYGDTHAKAVKVPYCWHCGAKMSYADMRGGENE